MNLDRLVDEIMQEIPEFTIPKAYVRSLIEENIDCFDTRVEVLSETKMQLTEESGMEFLLTREEAEEYLCDEMPDEKWDQISENGMVSSRLLKAMEDDEESTLFELLKKMPLIPAAKMIGSIVLKNLEQRGIELGPDEADALCMSVIEDLNTSLGELNGEFDDDDDDEGDFEDTEDVFGELGIGFDMEDPGEPVNPDNIQIPRGRRSRITRFPGKK